VKEFKGTLPAEIVAEPFLTAECNLAEQDIEQFWTKKYELH
jgi:hypothetical protein